MKHLFYFPKYYIIYVENFKNNFSENILLIKIYAIKVSAELSLGTLMLTKVVFPISINSKN